MNTGAHDTPDAGDFCIDKLDYVLPESLIAQHPPKAREDARMLVVNRADGSLSDLGIAALPQVLRAGDLLVLNDTKVLPARFLARRSTGGAVGGLFLSEETPGVWRVMLQGSRRLKIGETLPVQGAGTEVVELCLLENCGAGEWRVSVNSAGSPEAILEQVGRPPLPPYIRRQSGSDESDPQDRSRYQTVYACKPGAVAAPTAGLHLTGNLLDRLREGGIETTLVTLHVGAGTFRPISVNRLREHDMHTEAFELPEEAAQAVRRCRERSGHVVAVGTTSVRVLESSVETGAERLVRAQRGTTDLFLYPPHSLQVVDVMLTNFHLPRSTLLALVMAFAGVETTRRAYEYAIARKYRFYSYGDAMLIQ